MTDNTEPTIDELFDAIEIFDGDDSNGREYQAGYNDMALACRLMKEQIRIEVKQAVSDQVAKARIDELEHIVSGSEYSADDFDWYEITRAEYTGTKYYSEVRHLTKEERIAELEATLNGVKNK